jgi:hypothetical protein
MASHIRWAGGKDPIGLVSYKDAKIVAAALQRIGNKTMRGFDDSFDECGYPC